VSGCVGPYLVQSVPSTGVCMTLTLKASPIYFRIVFLLRIAAVRSLRIVFICHVDCRLCRQSLYIATVP